MPAFAEVVLTASPASEFERWSGACQEVHDGDLHRVPLGDDVVARAKFRDDPDNPELIPPRMRSQLRVAVEPAGSGTVSSSRSRLSEAIACNPTCKARFQQGEKVTLEAVANAALGARFVQWQGGAPYCAAGATCRSFRRSTSRRSARVRVSRPVRAAPRRHARPRSVRRRAGRRALRRRRRERRLRGMDGDDCIDGGAGNDRLEGGTGTTG